MEMKESGMVVGVDRHALTGLMLRPSFDALEVSPWMRAVDVVKSP